MPVGLPPLAQHVPRPAVPAQRPTAPDGAPTAAVPAPPRLPAVLPAAPFAPQAALARQPAGRAPGLRVATAPPGATGAPHPRLDAQLGGDGAIRVGQPT